jgi:hypothetical protein
MSKMNWSAAILFCAISLLGSGCTVQMKPILKYSEVPVEALPNEIDFTGTVAVLNNQPSKKKIRIDNSGGGKYVANLHDWTQMAVMHTETALQDLGGSVGGNGLKVLRLSVTGMKLEDTAGGQICTINLNADTNDGRTHDYEIAHYATAGFVLSPRYACSKAISDAISELLNDPETHKLLEAPQ